MELISIQKSQTIKSTVVKPTKESFEKVREILNKPRPYRSSDSKRQHFIPNL